MAIYDQDSDVIQWGLRLLDGDPPFYSGYYGVIVQNEDSYHGQYIRDQYDISDCTNVGSDEIIARTLQEELSQLAVAEASGYSPARDEHLQTSISAHDWHCSPIRSYNLDHDDSYEDPDDTCSSPGNREECSYSPEFAYEDEIDGEVGRRLNQMIPIPLYDFVDFKVQGDGNCQFRALSDQLYSTPDHHKVVRRQIVNQLRSHRDIYEGYVPMEHGDYLRKMSR